MSYNLLMGSKYSANIVPPQPFKKSLKMVKIEKSDFQVTVVAQVLKFSLN